MADPKARFDFARLDEWVLKTERRTEAVIKASAQAVMDTAQQPVAKGGNMPVDTGFLRNSLRSSVSGQAVSAGGESYVLAAASLRAGDVARFEWTAEYAPHVEYGARGRPGRFFMRNAAAQWQRIVDEQTQAAKAAVR